MEKLGFGIERKNTELYPTIDSAKCNSYISYLNKCKNKVYAVEEKKTIVKKPYNCIVEFTKSACLPKKRNKPFAKGNFI